MPQKRQQPYADGSTGFRLMLAVMLGGASALATPAPAPLQLEPGQRQLMIDDILLDDSRAENPAGIAPVIRMHPAKKTGQLMIVADKPWEGVIFYYDSIVRVNEDEFRIYYEYVALSSHSGLIERQAYCMCFVLCRLPRIHVDSTFGPKGRFLCVAVSNDTITWTKPVLNNIVFENSTANSESSDFSCCGKRI